ncbi:MAG: AraC family transcriptional regulator [Planctomycetota bacterium]
MLKIEFSALGHRTFGREWKGFTPNETFARLYYIYAGEAIINHHGQSFTMTPGSLYLIPPKSGMKFHCPKSYQVGWVHFNISLYGHLDLFETHSSSYVYTGSKEEKRGEQMAELVSLVEREDLFSQFKAKSILFDLVSCFFTFKKTPLSKTDQSLLQRFAPVLDYIDNHLGEKISVNQLAEIAVYEKTYFSTLFKKIYSVSPFTYIQDRKIEKVRSILRSKDTKLSVIAAELGFNDEFHLSKTFKKITGESPSRFRKRMNLLMP